MIPLKLVGHFYVDGYGIVTTYEDGYGVKYSTAAQEIVIKRLADFSEVGVVFDGYGEASNKIITTHAKKSKPKPSSAPPIPGSGKTKLVKQPATPTAPTTPPKPRMPNIK